MKLYNANLAAVQPKSPETVLTEAQLEDLRSVLYQRLVSKLTDEIVSTLTNDPGFLENLAKKLDQTKSRKTPSSS